MIPGHIPVPIPVPIRFEVAFGKAEDDHASSSQEVAH
eukprot:CAMPEP_0174297686 /NCGR_PEP_ID=MMETSP0809-20121228/51723_1 /TAXON_ID=73025 ORGANISM="Eutreptiella gymnastica-like, Strain CCMP1594" /NCGR_SAMPLE_ID=MMETSP0809 /ASSEMBLY_ACC=CAM_ASM_000658 /LENGTH=36 /DNA_ID= /DNA_START= /DNA_END= /DNA_ORIENTATION=